MTDIDDELSPCIGVCALDPVTGYCLGCRRTIEEIASWGSMPEEEKRRVIAELSDREDDPGTRSGTEGGED